MRRNRALVISAVICGIAILLAKSVLPPRSSLGIAVVGVEPSAMFFGEEEAMFVTLSVSNSDIVDVTYEIPSFEANIGGRWIEIQQVGGMSRMSAGATREERLVMPGGTKCRVQLRYAPDSWKSRLEVRIGTTGQKWVSTSPWLAERVLPNLPELKEIEGYGDPIRDSDRFNAVLKFYRNKGDPLEFDTILQDPVPYIDEGRQWGRI